MVLAHSVCVCVRACVHACMRACVHACVRACVLVVLTSNRLDGASSQCVCVYTCSSDI